MKALFCCCVAVSALLCGCRTVSSGERGFQPVPPDERSRQLTKSQKLGTGILTAFQKHDFQNFCKNSPGDLIDHVTEKDFQTSCRNFSDKFGELKSFKFLTSLATPAFENLIWIVTFVRAGTDGQPVEQQLLFRLVTMQVDGAIQVVSYGFL